jgi:hypothetical protein
MKLLEALQEKLEQDIETEARRTASDSCDEVFARIGTGFKHHGLLDSRPDVPIDVIDANGMLGWLREKLQKAIYEVQKHELLEKAISNLLGETSQERCDRKRKASK